MAIVGFMDYTKAPNDQLRSASNAEPLPVTLSGGATSVAGAVWGPDANASPPTRPPVYIAGFDGTNVRQVVVNTAGRLVLEANVGIANADNAGISSNTGFYTIGRNYLLNTSTTWDRIRSVALASNTVAAGVQAIDNPVWSTSDLLNTAINAAGAGDNTIVAGVAGQTIRTHRLVLVAAGAVNVIIKDGAVTNLTGAMPMVAGVPYILSLDTGRPWFKTSAANNLVLNLSAAVAVAGFVQYAQSA